jgi:hypothetical protein
VSWRKKLDQNQKVCLTTFWILREIKCSLDVRRILPRGRRILGFIFLIMYKSKMDYSVSTDLLLQVRFTGLCYVNNETHEPRTDMMHFYRADS